MLPKSGWTFLAVYLPTRKKIVKNYLLYIKSHCAYPDFEDSVMAESKEDAVEYFYDSLKGEYDRKWLMENVVAEDEINK